MRIVNRYLIKRLSIVCKVDFCKKIFAADEKSIISRNLIRQVVTIDFFFVTH